MILSCAASLFRDSVFDAVLTITPLLMPMFKTIIDVLLHRASNTHKGVTFMENHKSISFYPYASLLKDALCALGHMQQLGLKKGDELVIQLDDNQQFLIVFWASILGGIIPVPLSIGNTEEHYKKLIATWKVLCNPYFLSTQKNFARSNAFLSEQGLEAEAAEIIQRSLDIEQLLQSNEEGLLYSAVPEDIAFIQFSSGSTGTPKGVMLTHHNLLVNIDAIASAAKYSEQDVLLSWMPLTHDMGLIGFHLNPLYSGLDHGLIPTSSFIRRPSLWLDMANNYGATVLCSPNFGYEYVLKYFRSDSDQKWDLSKVRIIYNGAEPISEKIAHQFLAGFARFGLRPEAMCPVYGLAEASLAVSMSALDEELKTVTLDRRKLGLGDAIKFVEPSAEDAISIVNLGKAVNDCAISIRDEAGNELSEQIIGQICIRGAAVSNGYYNNPQASNEIRILDGWLRTGDLGFMEQSCLFVTGRVKDIFFVNGQNFYPYDIENAAQEMPGIELNKIAVAGFFNHQTQSEEILAFVFFRGHLAEFIPIAAGVTQFISQKIGLVFSHVIPVKDMPRTTSGKLQRFKLLERYTNGAYDGVLAAIQQAWALNESSTFQLGTTPNPQGILQIWQQVLGKSDIDPAASFFAYTGSSLKVAEMLMRLQKTWHVELEIEKVYTNPTIAGLMQAILSVTKAEEKPSIALSHLTHHPATENQKRLYYQWLGQPDSIAYNVPVAFCLTPTIDTKKLEKCLHSLILRHDSLRMNFVLQGEDLKLFVHPEVQFNLNVLVGENADVRQTLANLVRPFDLHQDVLMRCTLLEFPDKMTAYLLFDFHHSIADGVSIHLLIQELVALYNGEQLTPLLLGFKDWSTWLNNQTFPAQVMYWQQRLNDEWPLLHLPSDHQRPIFFDGKGAKLFFELEATLSEKVHHLARKQQCTLHSLLLTVYKILLSKYTGQEDVVIGIPVAGRRNKAVQSILGMFVNTLALRRLHSGEETFATMLSEEQKHLHEVLANQDLPFGTLVDLSKMRQDPGRHPIFDTMFIYQNMGAIFAPLGATQLKRFPFDPGFAKYDLSMEVFEEDNQFSFAFEYATSLFDKARIERLALHFIHLLEQIVHQPNAIVSDLDLVDSAERKYLFQTFNQTQADYPSTTTVLLLFEQQARTHPQNIALEIKDQKISYQQLNDQAETLASYLRQKGLEAGSVVAIHLPRSTELIIAILAVLKVGATYLPIDTVLPVERIGYMVENSCSELMITTRAQGTQLSSVVNLSVELLFLDQEEWEKAAVPSILRKEQSTGAPVYIIYTSGTTGKPKGVVIGQKSLVNYCIWAAKNYIDHSNAAFPLFSSISFDLTITSIFVPLITGNKILIYSQEEATLSLEMALNDNQATVLKLTPAHLRLMADPSWNKSIEKSKIKRLIVGGEKLDTQLAQSINQLYGNRIEIINEYGPTEATVGCMIHRFNPAENYSSVPIGIPADNVHIYLLDQYQKLVPLGLVGEIYIAGDCLAEGYLYDEQLSNAKFVNNPFAAGTRMYKTGDQAKFLANGTIEYLGRFDQQKKINGYRVELEEIEARINEYPEIKEVLVTLSQEGEESPKLIAYYTSRSAISPKAFMAFLTPKLPYYMIPIHYVHLVQLPLNSNGKINYFALPKVDFIQSDALVPARNAFEQTLVDIWKQVLGTATVGIYDNFFALGGDSIKAVQISARLYERGFKLPSHLILTTPIIDQLAAHMDYLLTSNANKQKSLEGTLEPWPIISWFWNQGFKRPGYFNQAVLLEFKKTIDTAILARAFQYLILKHDGLRLNWQMDSGLLFYNTEHLNIQIELEQFRYPHIQTTQEMLDAFLQEGGLEFDLTNDLLIKPICLSNAHTEDFLLIVAHHLIVDGVSWRILLHDLEQFYHALERGEKQVTIGHKSDSLLDWEAAFAKFSRSYAHISRLEYWENVEKAPSRLPQLEETNQWDEINLTILHKQIKGLRTFLIESKHQHQLDASYLLQAALLEALNRWTGQSQFVVMQENHGRHLDEVDVSATVGWFTAMYPMLCVWKGKDWAEKLKLWKEQIQNLPENGLGYGAWKYKSSPNNSKIPAIRFNYLGDFSAETNNELFALCKESPGLLTHPLNHLTAQIDINVSLIEDLLQMEIGFNNQAHATTSIQFLVDSWVEELYVLQEFLRQNPALEFDELMTVHVDLSDQEFDELFQ